MTLEFFLTLSRSCVLFVCHLCALSRIRELSLIRDSYYIYTERERKKIHEFSGRGEDRDEEGNED